MFIGLPVISLSAPRPHTVRQNVFVGQSKFQTMRAIAQSGNDLKQYKIIHVADDL